MDSGRCGGRVAGFGPWVLILAAGLVRGAAAAAAGGFVAVSTDDLYHGLSESAGDPSVSAGVDYRTDQNAFLGLTAATVKLNPGPGAPLELAAFVGRAVEWNAGWSGHIELAHDEYPGDAGLGYAYTEAVASLSWRETLTGTLSYSPDSSRYSTQGVNRHRPAEAVEGAVRWPIGARGMISAGVGYRQFAAPIDTGYAYGSAGVSLAWRRWQFDFSVVDTSRRAQSLFGATTAERRCVLAAVLRFGDGVADR